MYEEIIHFLKMYSSCVIEQGNNVESVLCKQINLPEVETVIVYKTVFESQVKS